jgi:hypothetical protein
MEEGRVSEGKDFALVGNGTRYLVAKVAEGIRVEEEPVDVIFGSRAPQKLPKGFLPESCFRDTLWGGNNNKCGSDVRNQSCQKNIRRRRAGCRYELESLARHAKESLLKDSKNSCQGMSQSSLQCHLFVRDTNITPDRSP